MSDICDGTCHSIDRSHTHSPMPLTKCVDSEDGYHDDCCTDDTHAHMRELKRIKLTNTISVYALTVESYDADENYTYNVDTEIAHKLVQRCMLIKEIREDVRSANLMSDDFPGNQDEGTEGEPVGDISLKIVSFSNEEDAKAACKLADTNFGYRPLQITFTGLMRDVCIGYDIYGSS